MEGSDGVLNAIMPRHLTGQARKVTKYFIQLCEEHNWGSNQVKVKVKQSLYGPRWALRVPEFLGSQIFIQSAHECGKVVGPTYLPPLPPTISVRNWLDPRVIVRPEWKISVTPWGTESATFRLVAQCLNQLCHRKLLQYAQKSTQISI
jgi:hypothetical protein